MPIGRPRRSASEREITLDAARLAQGVSRQPAHQRFPGQVEEAVNVQFDIAAGIRKRPGTVFDRRITVSHGIALVKGGNYRIHPIVRDETERYLVLYGDTEVKVFDIVNGDQATVTAVGSAAHYLDINTPTADQMRLLTDEDTTFILNTTVPVVTRASDAFDQSGGWRDFAVMTSNTPTDQTYHRATQDQPGGEEAGYWQYDVDGVTFATIKFPEMTNNSNATPIGAYDDDAGDPYGAGPYGFRIRFQRLPLSITGGSWATATRRLTKTGAFASYVWTEKDAIKVTGGTNINADWYRVKAKISDDTIELFAEISSDNANHSDVTASSLALECDIEYRSDHPNQGGDGPQVDMYAVAAKFQESLRRAGASDGLVAWTPTGDKAGYFTITSPYRGANATILDLEAAPDLQDLGASSGDPFYRTGTTITAGTGTATMDTMPVADRWTRVAAPDDIAAALDERTMPLKLFRTVKGPSAKFRLQQIDWNDRLSGTAVSNPPLSLWNKATARGTFTNSVANPTVLTSAAHGLTNGQIISIIGSTSTPNIDGNYPIANVTTDTFTIDVNVTVAGAGTWHLGAVPIRDMAISASRFFFCGANLIVASQARDLFNFWIDDVRNLVDSDPLSVALADVSGVDWLVPFRRTLFASAAPRQQFELATPEALTPATVRFEPTTAIELVSPSAGVKPKPSTHDLMFVGPTTTNAALWSYKFDDILQSQSADDVSQHVPDYLPLEARTMVTAPNEGLTIILEENASELLVYRTSRKGNQTQQAAWCRWVFDPSYRIVDIAVVATDLWMLVEEAQPVTIEAGTPGVVTYPGHGYNNGDTVLIIESDTNPSADGEHTVANKTADTFELSGFNVTTGGTARVARGVYMLEHVTLSRERTIPADGYLPAWPYAIHLDRQIYDTGTYDAMTDRTTWTVPSGFFGDGSTLNRVVLGPAFGDDAGTVLTLQYYGATTVGLDGDYSDGDVCLGCFYEMEVTLSQPFIRDDQGNADLKSTLLHKELIVTHEKSGDYQVNATFSGGGAPDPSETAFTPLPDAQVSPKGGELHAWIGGPVENVEISIFSDSPRPVCIGAVQHIGDYAAV